MQDDLQKSDSCHQVSERKKVVTSSNDSLACALIDLGAFGSMGVHLPSEKPILPYFSSLSMVAILVCDSHRQAGSSTCPLNPALVHHRVSECPSDYELISAENSLSPFTHKPPSLLHLPLNPPMARHRVSVPSCHPPALIQSPPLLT